jgi:hypothetical protein
MDIKQRWIVVNSKAAGERATKTMGRQTDRAKEKLDKDLFHLQAQRFACGNAQSTHEAVQLIVISSDIGTAVRIRLALTGLLQILNANVIPAAKTLKKFDVIIYNLLILFFCILRSGCLFLR